MKSLRIILVQLMGNNYTGDRNEMALLPEGITELLHHKKLLLPLVCSIVLVHLHMF